MTAPLKSDDRDRVSEELSRVVNSRSRRALLSTLLMPIRLNLTGPAGGIWTLLTTREHGVRVLRGASCIASTSIHMSADDFLTWVQHPDAAPSTVKFGGDHHLAERVYRAISAPLADAEKGTS